MAEAFYVYILATRKDGPLYVGITSDLHRRVFEHKTHAFQGSRLATMLIGWSISRFSRILKRLLPVKSSLRSGVARGRLS